jgi:pyruvate dehydrogenase E2 component (dihydrolipoamide acetyltransferase)
VVAATITVPRLGWSMEEGTFAGWLKQDGDPVQPGDRLFLLESDKSTEEIEAVDAGILHIPPDAPKVGDKVKVGQVLAHLLAPGEEAPPARRTPTVSEAVPRKQTTQQARRPPVTVSRRQRAISPRARRVAAELGIEWSKLEGSGRNGRIRERDVRTVAAGPARGRLIPHTNVRRLIATRMVAGVTEAAPVTLIARVDAENLVGLREQFHKAVNSPGEIVPSYTDLILKLTAVALRRHPLLQAQWSDNGLFVPERIDIALAVDTEEGLLVPVVRAADTLSVRQIAEQSRELVTQARAGRLSSEQMRDATFTITNLGSFGIDAFTPIIHLPQCAILGVGCIAREPAVVGERVVPRHRMTLSLTFDHRIVDGAPAARFLATLRQCLENPSPWLIP